MIVDFIDIDSLAHTSLLAQATTVETKNYFEMFFVAGDLIGQLIIIFLVLLSLVSTSLAINMALTIRRGTVLPQTTIDRVKTLIDQGKHQQAAQSLQTDTSFLGRILAAGLNEAEHGYVAMEQAILDTADLAISQRIRRMEYLSVLGNVSPMIGLFGTVYGMVVAFQALVSTGGSPEPAELAAGISTALVTTLWGLVVAIPALTAYSLLRNRYDALTGEALVICEQLIEPLKPTALLTGETKQVTTPPLPKKS